MRRLAKRARDWYLRCGPEERQRVPLCDDGAGDRGDTADVPCYSLYLPEPQKARDIGVVVFPGGGYVGHAEHEAAPVGRWLRSLGVAAMVVRYRVAPDAKHPDMLDDARRAVQIMRAHSEEWRSACVGVLGFSAGGHLAGLTALTWDRDTLNGIAGPDFAVLVYPVVCMVGPYAHAGCRGALLGQTAETELARSLSLENLVTSGAPPIFLVHGMDDSVIDVRNSLCLAEAYAAQRRPCELHVFASGPHGFGLGERGRPAAAWPGLCDAWLRAVFG